MAENLKVTRDAEGNNITRYCYDNNTTNCELYGGLYNWHTVMNGQSSSSSNPSGVQGICPDGWHVPSFEEWTQLVDYIMDELEYHNDWLSNDINGVANALKSCRQVDSPLGDGCSTSEHPRWNSHGTHSGFDEFGFSALPGGGRWSGGNFDHVGYGGYWWSAAEYSGAEARGRCMFSNYGYVTRLILSKSNGFSIRCLNL